jgi:hypothetical protein
LQNSSIPDVFQLFLSQRQQFMFESLSHYVKESTEELLELLKGLVDCILVTLAQAERMFCSLEESSKLEHNLRTILNLGSESGGSVAQFYSENSKMSFLFRFVPLNVRQYAPAVNLKSKLRNKDIEDFLNIWTTSFLGPIHERLLILLSQMNLPSKIAELSSGLFAFLSESLKAQKSTVYRFN